MNNEAVNPKIEIPMAADMLTMDEEEMNELKEIKVYEGKVHKEGESEFCAFYQHARDEQEIQKGYTKLKMKHRDATHIVLAYKLAGATGPYKQAYVDDGEAGAGRRMLSVLKNSEMENIAVYVVRYYSGAHMGKRRFEIYEMLAKSAMKALKTKLDKLERTHRMRRSNSQLSQLSQSSIASMLDDDANV